MLFPVAAPILLGKFRDRDGRRCYLEDVRQFIEIGLVSAAESAHVPTPPCLPGRDTLHRLPAVMIVDTYLDPGFGHSHQKITESVPRGPHRCVSSSSARSAPALHPYCHPSLLIVPVASLAAPESFPAESTLSPAVVQAELRFLYDKYRAGKLLLVFLTIRQILQSAGLKVIRHKYPTEGSLSPSPCIPIPPPVPIVTCSSPFPGPWPVIRSAVRAAAVRCTNGPTPIRHGPCPERHRPPAVPARHPAPPHDP